MKVYLDNCCFNRPYDNQSYLTISIETLAKLQIQALIKAEKLMLASSFILEYENFCNPYPDRKAAIQQFLDENVVDYVGRNLSDQVVLNAKKIMATGVKMKDACHIACAEMMNCDYLLSTDKRMLKCKSESMELLNPIEFIDLVSGGLENDN